MPCHPARARELVRKGRAYWVKRDTVKLKTFLQNAVCQHTVLGIDAGAIHIGLAVVAKREKRKPKVLFRAQVDARPMSEIKSVMDKRRSLRRNRRSRKGYRQPWYSPTRRVGLTAKLFKKSGEFLCKIPLAEGKRLLKPDKGGNRQAKRLGGNKYQLSTMKEIKAPKREKEPGKNDIVVYRFDGRPLTWFSPKSRKFVKQLCKCLRGYGKVRRLPVADVKKEGDKVKSIWLKSRRAERLIPKNILPEVVPPFRKMGQKRKPSGWLAPSANALVNAYFNGIKRVGSYVPIASVRFEDVAFDTRKLEDCLDGKGDCSTVNYARQNRKDFVLARDGWKCVYCGRKSNFSKKGLRLTQDHVVPKSKNGSNAIGNLVACCEKCNSDKGSLDLDDYLKKREQQGDKPSDTKRIKRYVVGLSQKSESFRSKAHVGQVKTKVLRLLRERFEDVSITKGYVTKKDRDWMGLTKSHDCDAVAIAAYGERVGFMPPLRTYHVRRYTWEGSRRRQYSANPMKKYSSKCVLIAKGTPRERWVQPNSYNPYADTKVGRVYSRDVVLAVGGNKGTEPVLGYIRGICKDGALFISRLPTGGKKKERSKRQAKYVKKIISRCRGLMEVL